MSEIKNHFDHLSSAERIKCPICREKKYSIELHSHEEKQKKSIPNDYQMKNSESNNLISCSAINISPTKIVKGGFVFCQNPNCTVCNKFNFEYVLDLPGKCKFCEECNCCEGIIKIATFN